MPVVNVNLVLDEAIYKDVMAGTLELCGMVKDQKHRVRKHVPTVFDSAKEGAAKAIDIVRNHKKELLIVGPFQGLPACVEIKIGKGVCGTAVEKNEIMLVKDVHEFPGHIACDCASNSEIVLPLHNANGDVVAVLDIDSPTLARFDKEDKEGLSAIAQVIEKIM